MLKDFAVAPAAVSDDVDELSGCFARSDEWTATLRHTETDLVGLELTQLR